MFRKALSKSFSTFQSVNDIKSVGVIGAGQMGTGIAIVANRVAGLKVKIVDMSEEQLSNSRKFTESWLDKEIKKERLTNDEKYQILDRFTYSTLQ